MALIFCESWSTVGILRSRFWCNQDILCAVSIIPFDKKCHSQRETFVLWQWDYFGSTLWQIALCMIQFARAVFSENSLCTLEFSILECCTTLLDTIQTMIFSDALFFCMPSSNCLARLAKGQVSSILNNVVRWTVPQDAHTFVHVYTQMVGKLYFRSCKLELTINICTWSLDWWRYF